MKVIATSDLHGSLPEIEPCDILLIGGDSCPVKDHDLEYQQKWIETTFAEWIEELPAKHIVIIAGNHDFILQSASSVLDILPSHVRYLEDTEVELEGLRIYGTPWVPNLRRWAFYGGKNGCFGHFDQIPEGLDILLSHGPMRGYGDRLAGINLMTGEYEHIGCTSMVNQIPRIKPKVFVCGHIHEGRGVYDHPDIEYGIWNVAHMDAMYDPVGEPVELTDFTYQQ